MCFIYLGNSFALKNIMDEHRTGDDSLGLHKHLESACKVVRIAERFSLHLPWERVYGLHHILKKGL